MRLAKRLATTANQPPFEVVLDRPDGLALHYSNTFVNFTSWEFSQVQPAFFNQFVINHKIGVHLHKDLDRNSERVLRKNLRLGFRARPLTGRKGESLKRRQTRKEYPGHATAELKVLVMSVHRAAVLEDLHHRITVKREFPDRKAGILGRTSGCAATVRALALVHAVDTTPFRHSAILRPRNLTHLRFRSRSISARACSRGVGVSPEAFASSYARMSARSSRRSMISS
jgi:hypothetical protein